MSRLFSPSAGLEAPGSGAAGSRARGLEGQPHAVWKEVSLGAEGVGGEAGWPRQVASEGEECREHRPPQPLSRASWRVSTFCRQWFPKILFIQRFPVGVWRGNPQEQTWLRVQLPPVPSPRLWTPLNLSGNLVKVRQA